MNRQVSMVKDKTKDGAVPGMVESEVRMGGNGVHSVFDSDIVGCPLAVWWIDRKYLGYSYGSESCSQLRKHDYQLYSQLARVAVEGEV